MLRLRREIVKINRMKKLLGIVVLGLLLSGNAYALFHKLPTLKCKVTPLNANAFTIFLKL